jgi:glyoxylase-like metal-dependent hydrolase (beta-lactamase superfamily II)
MNKIYAIIQGEREVEDYSMLPWPVAVGGKVRLAYYIWCIKGNETAILVDTGFRDADAIKRNIKTTEYLKAQLKKLGVNPETIETVLVTHLHVDHFSAYELYSKAAFYIQRREIEFFTGPAITLPHVAELSPYMSEVMRLVYGKRIRYLDGDAQIASGVRVVLVGGHTPGSQVVKVTTKKGEVVLCGDTIDFYRNLDEGIPGLGVDLLQTLLAWQKVRALASSPEFLIPGHDPLLLKKFPNPSEGIVEIA